MFNLQKLVRENIVKLKPYVSGKNDYAENIIFLNANENPFGDGCENRYPDPHQFKLRESLSKRNNIDVSQIMLGNGSDELIDIIIRIFCEPKKDSILICPPTFGMYEISANINDIFVEKIPLNNDYQLDTSSIINSNAKIIFLPSPNSPTGNKFEVSALKTILKNFKGLVVIDEAYVDFSREKSWISELSSFPNLIILQTFSKYWSLAGCRIGMVFSSAEIIGFMKKIKMPYNVNSLSTKKALKAIENEDEIQKNSQIIITERNSLIKSLSNFSFIEKIFPTETNFIWVKTFEAKKIELFLREKGIIIRSYSDYPDFLRISVGSLIENKKLLNSLEKYK